MIKVGNTGQTLTTGQVIPLTQVRNTNNRFTLQNDNVIPRDVGIVEIQGNFVVSGTGTDVTIQLYNGETPLTALATETYGSDTTTSTLTIVDKEIIQSALSGNVSFNFVVTGNCTLTSAYITFSY